jgi:hypothetical protein
MAGQIYYALSQARQVSFTNPSCIVVRNRLHELGTSGVVDQTRVPLIMLQSASHVAAAESEAMLPPRVERPPPPPPSLPEAMPASCGLKRCAQTAPPSSPAGMQAGAQDPRRGARARGAAVAVPLRPGGPRRGAVPSRRDLLVPGAALSL